MSKQSLIDRFLAILAEEEKEQLSPEISTPDAPSKVNKVGEDNLAKGRELALEMKNNKRNMRKQMIINFIAENGVAQANHISRGLGIPKSTVGKLVMEMRNEGVIVRQGVGFETSYVIGTGKVAPVEKVVGRQRIHRAQPETAEQYTEAILDFASKHDGENYSVYKMGELLKIPNGNVYYYADKLVKRGLLVKDFNRGNVALKPASNQVIAEAVKSAEGIPAFDAVLAKDELYHKIEFLVWDYVKNTRSTDVLGFLTYLEEKCK